MTDDQELRPEVSSVGRRNLTEEMEGGTSSVGGQPGDGDVMEPSGEGGRGHCVE